MLALCVAVPVDSDDSEAVNGAGILLSPHLPSPRPSPFYTMNRLRSLVNPGHASAESPRLPATAIHNIVATSSTFNNIAGHQYNITSPPLGPLPSTP
jgi:hypothetical protein